MSTGPVQRLRGATASPPHKAFAATAHIASSVPDTYTVIPKQLSMWGNSTYGDCVSAEEAYAKAAASVAATYPELFITEQEVVTWAHQHGFLNGAYLTEVMDAMAKTGMVASDGKTYTDGPYQSVDWTNDAVLSSAIYSGPVKIGVAAGQLENAVGGSNGWFGLSFSRDQNIDHCVALTGYGTLAQLCTALGVTAPSGADPNQRCYLLYTWDTIGIVSQQSMINITAEAWLRTPTTPQQPVPTPPVPPTPTPIPPGPPIPVPPVPPTPTPTPTPTPGMIYGSVDPTTGTITLTGAALAKSDLGAFNWQMILQILAQILPIILPLLKPGAAIGNVDDLAVKCNNELVRAGGSPMAGLTWQQWLALIQQILAILQPLFPPPTP